MPRVRSTFEASQFLDDTDCDISEESSGILDFNLNIRRKFGVVLKQARQLKTELLAVQEKIIDLTSQHQQELSRLQKFATTTRNQLRAQGRTLHQSKVENQRLRRRVEELARDLEDTHKELDQVDHLRCSICKVTIQNAVTKCGHGFCNLCLTEWLRDPLHKCPICVQVVESCDIRKVFLGPDESNSAILDNDRATEILSLDSDSE